MTKEKRNFGAALVEILLAPVARLPLGFHLAWSKFFAWILRDVVRYRRDVIVTNLSRSFPELGCKEITRLTRKVYSHFGDICAEAIWFGGCKGAKGRRRLNESGIVDIVNPEVFNDLYDKCGSVMILCSHMGNWELLGGWFTYNHSKEVPMKSGYPEIGVVYRRLKSRTWNRVIADNRCNCLKGSGFHGYLETEEVLRFAITHRREKFVYVFITDQHPYRMATKHNVGRFMNQETVTMTGGAALANKLKMGVGYVNMKQTGRGKYSMEFKRLCYDASAETPERIMEMYYAELEKDLREQPWNYLWTHRRWKK